MSVPYERYNDDIEAAEQSSLSSEEGGIQPVARPDVLILQRKQRRREIFRDRWPRGIGVVQMVTGFCIGILGAVNVMVLPLVLVTEPVGKQTIQLNAVNLWGLGLWAGLILIVTGSLGLRASMYQSVSTVYAYFGCILFDVLAYIAFMLIILSHGFSDFTVHGPMAPLYITQLVVNILVCVGFLLIMVAFTQYYEDVFCGELQCLRRACHCCLPCWCPRVVEPEELMSEDGRPPSLPI